MSGRHAFDELTKGFTPNRRERVEARKAELRAAMPFHELRKARAMTQKAVDEVLRVNQPAVAKLERRANMYVSNLRVYIEAMGQVEHCRQVSARQRGHHQLLRRRGGSEGRMTAADRRFSASRRRRSFREDRIPTRDP